MKPRVLVSGCFDLLHSGHVRFFEEAAAHGELHVAVGSDRTVAGLKGRPPVTSQDERLFMVQSLTCVAGAFISSGNGRLDFEPEMRRLRPERFVVNDDGDSPEKRQLATELGSEYIVLNRSPRPGLPGRSTTDLRGLDLLPYRIDLCGGWLDQPFVSRHHPGSVLTIGIEPGHAFNERSGMATSTRRTASRIWGSTLPPGEPELLASILFACDNPPGTTEVSGSQDAIGLVYPGLAVAHYEGDYWPSGILHIRDEGVLRFVESALYLISLPPRGDEYDVLADTRIDQAAAGALARASEDCLHAIRGYDLAALGRAVLDGFEAQVAMFPNMVTPSVREGIDSLPASALGWKVSGAGGGGYLIVVSGEPIPNALRITIRRPEP